MDLANFDLKANADRGFDVAVTNPIDDSETDIIVSVVGSDSARYRNANIAAMVEIPLDDSMPTAERVDAVTRRASLILAACVTGWVGIEVDGKVLELTEASAVELLAQYDWIADQLSEKIKNRENFA
jgi:hypothetical protein